MGHDHNPETGEINPPFEQSKPDFDTALARVLAGEAMPNDPSFLDDRSGVPDTITAVTGDFTHLPFPPGFDARMRWQRLEARINTPAEQLFNKQEKNRARRFLLPSGFWLSRSGMLGISTALALMFIGYFSMSDRQSAPGVSVSAATIIATRNSQQSTVTLLDGTVVTLNVASRLEIPEDFNSGNRTVRLDGEALFSVNPRSGNAFTVIAGGTPTRVLGTTFSVRKYETDNGVTVAVQDGKVSVRSVVLTANQQAKIGMDDTVWVHPANPAQFRFARGVLDLDGIPILQAISELNRWYDADIEIGDSALAHRNIRATFSTGSISDMAEVLGLVFDARVVVNGKKVILYSKE